VLVLGHLGNHLDDFGRVRALGAHGVELDVRRGPDGRLLVHHDPIGPDAAARAPELVDVLDACAGLLVNVELKNLRVDPDFDPGESLAAGVVRLLADRGGADRVVVSSFAVAALDAVRAAAPQLPTAFLTLPDWDQSRAIAGAARRGHTGLHPHAASVDAALVEAARAAGLSITPWAVDDVATVEAMAALGVDAVISDTPEAISRALQLAR